MDKNVINHKFNIGEKIYHVLDDSPKGIITDIIYFFSTKRLIYKVVWSASYASECQEIELSHEKQVF